MDAFELLKADHQKVAKLFDQLEAATGKAKLGVFNQIKNELELHTHVEEKFLYPALEKPEETHDLTLEAYEEHNVVKTLLQELSGAKSANDEWQAKAKVLRENVEHHVEEEEGELFDKADKALSDEQIEQLGRQMEAEKARKQGRPAPKAAAASTNAKPAASKNAKPAASKNAKPGLLSKIANFVGLGSEPEKKTPAKKTAAKSSAKASTKATATKASKSKKSSGKTASKRESATQGAKRIPKPPTTSKGKSVGSRKNAGKQKGRS